MFWFRLSHFSICIFIASEFLTEHFSKSLSSTDKSDDVLQQLSEAASLLSKSMKDGAAHGDK